MKPILLATDGSPSAEAATCQAIELAQAFRAPLLVVSVAHVSLPVYGAYYGYGDVVNNLHGAEVERITGLLAEMKARVEDAGVPCDTMVLDGLAAEEICRVAHDHGARLVVVGAHGWGRVGRIVHGSVSTAVLHDAGCPVLVVRGDAEPLAEARPVTEMAVSH